MDIKLIKNNSKIQMLLDQFEVIIRSLKANGEVIDSIFSKFLAFSLISRLDFRTAKEFENSIDSLDSYMQFDTVQKF